MGETVGAVTLLTRKPFPFLILLWSLYPSKPGQAIPSALCHFKLAKTRNKVRLAVSWWRAIQTGEWARIHGKKPKETDLVDKYSFDAINHLLLESTMREAGIQELFNQASIIPLTITYEDFIANYTNTIHKVIDYLEIEYNNELQIAKPFFDKIADNISEEWVQRFRRERQAGWNNKGW